MEWPRLRIYEDDQREFISSLTSAHRGEYGGIEVAYFAKKSGDGIQLILGQVTLLPEREEFHEDFFEFKEYVAGRRRAPIEGWVSPLAEMLADGVIKTPIGNARIPGERDDDQLSIHIDDSHAQRDEPHLRRQSLLIRGKNIHEVCRGGLQSKEIDRQLKMAPTPFFGIQDLLRSINLSDLNADTNGCSLRISKGLRALIVVDEQSFEPRFTVPIVASSAIDKSALKLSIIASFEGSSTPDRFQYELRVEDFSAEGSTFKAVPDLVGDRRVVFAYVVLSYQDEFLQQAYFENPSYQSNLDVAMFRLMDAGLEKLNNWLAAGNDKDASSFEDAVHYLFHLLGFRSMLLGRNPRMKFVDIVVTPGSAKYFLIECTTGMPENDQKIGKLRRRVRTTREHFQKEGFVVPEILPVLATSLPRTEVSEFRAQLAKSKIILLDRDDFAALVLGLGAVASPIEVFDSLAKQLSTQQYPAFES